MLLKASDGILFLLEFALKGSFPDEGIGYRRYWSEGVLLCNWKESARNTLIPLFRIADVEQHFSLGISLHEFFVEGTKRGAQSPVSREEWRHPCFLSTSDDH